MSLPKNKKIGKSIDTIANRLNLLLAIVFLFGLALVGRLYHLQVAKGEYYLNKAEKQQKIYSTLEQERGKIYLNDHSQSLGKSELSLFATNKSFAQLYTVPSEMDKSQSELVAEKIYEVLHKARIEKEVDDFLKSEEAAELKKEFDYINSLPLSNEDKQARRNEVLANKAAQKNDPEWQEFYRVKRELEINELKQAVVGEYLSRLNKEDDPYEILEKKVSEEDLIKIYSALLATKGEDISPEDLEVKNGRVIKKIPAEGDAENNDLSLVYYQGLGYEMKSYRYYPEANTGSHVLGFVNYDGVGNYGLEGYYNEYLKGEAGYLKAEKSGGVKDSVIIVNDREYEKPKNGADLVLTIDRSVEFYVCKKLAESHDRYKFDRGTIIVVEPQSGAIIAMCSYPDFDPNNYTETEDQKIFTNPAISYQYEPGSVFKALTIAIALDQGKITPQTTYKDEGQVMISGWPKPIKNSDYDTAGGHGTVDMKTVLEKSLNTGAIFAMQQVGAKVFGEYVKNFGFGEETGLELSGEVSGNIKSLLKDKIRPVDAATASFGQGITVTPLQMLMSYAAIANKGVLMKPYIVKEIRYQDGTVESTQPQEVRRVISEQAAFTTSAMLAEVVEKGHSQKASVPGYYIGGKTGTAQVASKYGGYIEGQYNHTFVGIAPIDKPKFVMLVKLDNPKGFKFAESSAAPLFGEIADFLLNYYQVEKQR